MSSFIGHGLAALTIGKLFQPEQVGKTNFKWLAYLIICSVAPDIDYLVNSLNSANNEGVRITHSIGYCLFLPLILMTYFSVYKREYIWKGGLQAFLAGVSHLLLDTLVGSRQGDPWLYPLLIENYRLPFGLLPSAGAISLSNYYFYRNLLIELGVLLHIFLLFLTGFGKIKLSKAWIIILIAFLAFFLIWSINLTR